MFFSGMTGRVWKSDELWLVEVKALDLMTQGASGEDARSMVVDAIVCIVDDQTVSIEARDLDGEYFALFTNRVAVLEDLQINRCGTKIARTRKVMANYFKVFPDLKRGYIDNVAMLMRDRGWLKRPKKDRNEAAEAILDLIFEEKR